MNDLVSITKALADHTRLRILAALRGGELCVCQIVELFVLAPSTVSKHLAILRQAGLIESRKDGRWMYYRLAGPEAPPAVRSALDWLDGRWAGDREAETDAAKLAEILALDPEELCRRQANC